MTESQLLLIVDVQNDFIPGGALAVKEGDQIILLINQLQKQFKHIVATQDWHPQNHASFAKTHHKQLGEKISLDGITQILWPVHCVQDSWGASFVPGLHTDRIEKIFYKGTDPKVDSYSAIYDNAKKRSTGLEEYLKEKKIKEIFIVGLATDYCVKYSALDSCALGYKTTVIIDACRGVELQPGDVQKAIEEMRHAGARVIRSDQVH